MWKTRNLAMQKNIKIIKNLRFFLFTLLNLYPSQVYQRYKSASLQIYMEREKGHNSTLNITQEKITGRPACTKLYVNGECSTSELAEKSTFNRSLLENII